MQNQTSTLIYKYKDPKSPNFYNEDPKNFKYTLL